MENLNNRVSFRPLKTGFTVYSFTSPKKKALQKNSLCKFHSVSSATQWRIQGGGGGGQGLLTHSL